MKRNIIKLWCGLLFIVSGLLAGCEDKWDEHYSVYPVNSTEVTVYAGKVDSYIAGNADLSTLNNMLKAYKLLDQIATKNQQYTILAYTNETLASAQIEDSLYFLNTCISDIALAPNKLTDGLQLLMWNSKPLEVKLIEPGTKAGETAITIGGSTVVEAIQTDNGYIYVMDQPIYAPKSLYEYLTSLGEDYSMFKSMVLQYEMKVFDADKSTPVGIDETGNTIYDSVFTAKNTFYDRYTDRHHTTIKWDMFNEFYSSTMLLPTNEIYTEARQTAYDNVRGALGKEPDSGDSLRIEEWLLGAFFFSEKLTPEQLTGTEDLYGVAYFKESESTSPGGAQWRPSVQEVDVNNPIELSNGVAYRIKKMKVPNNVVIYRIKSRFYQVYEACDSAQLADYFHYINLDSNRLVYEPIKGGVGGWDEKTPLQLYKAIRAQPTAAVKEWANSVDTIVPVGLECTACMYNEKTGTVEVANVPAGEYYLRMGFPSVNNCEWRASIYFNGELVKTNFDTNTNCDRYGGNYYPYGYSPIDYYDKGSAAQNYDRDGSDIATVTLGNGPGDNNLYSFTLKIVDCTGNLAKGNTYFKIYHWTLRPTENNY